MSENKFIRRSNLTREEYDYFSCVKVKNMLQALKYMDNGCFPVDIRVEVGKDEKKLLVFYFIKENTIELFDKWCRYEL